VRKPALVASGNTREAARESGPIDPCPLPDARAGDKMRIACMGFDPVRPSSVSSSDHARSLTWQRLAPSGTFAAMIDRHCEEFAAACRPRNKVAHAFIEGLRRGCLASHGP
jgi:hypothetical protein